MRTALPAAVGHDLRTPLDLAKAAVSGLRAHDITLTAEDHDELLATVDDSWTCSPVSSPACWM
jgi:two-component system sensor histidine kinase KdpD